MATKSSSCTCHYFSNPSKWNPLYWLLSCPLQTLVHKQMHNNDNKSVCNHKRSRMSSLSSSLKDGITTSTYSPSATAARSTESYSTYPRRRLLPHLSSKSNPGMWLWWVVRNIHSSMTDIWFLAYLIWISDKWVIEHPFMYFLHPLSHPQPQSYHVLEDVVVVHSYSRFLQTLPP